MLKELYMNEKEIKRINEQNKNKNKDSLEKSSYALLRDLKPDKSSLEKSKISLIR